MRIQNHHSWDLTPKQAAAFQSELAGRVRLRDDPAVRRARLVCGADVSYSRPTNTCYAAVVVMTLPDFEIIEERSVARCATFPYVPGLLSFREAPPLLEAFRALRTEPDVIVFDGQGLAHPRGMGLACHLGVVLDRPSVGCAKNRLYGEHSDPGPERGEAVSLKHPETGRPIGSVLRSRTNVKPLFVSPGHHFSVRGALKFMRRCLGRYRLPEFARRAHALSNELRRQHESGDNR